MTVLSHEILENYQVRKTRKQKNAFIQMMRQHFPELKVQEGGFPKCRNIIIGNIENAKVILTAHYDTCAQLPFPNLITPTKPLLVILYSILLIVPLFVTVFLLNLLLGIFTADYWTHYWLSVVMCLGFVLLLIAGPANKHTANDNTSGVTVLCELAKTLDAAQRAKVAFVYFDHEETGLIGSFFFRSKYKKQMKDKLLFNFDCVADGDHILVTANKAARTDFSNALKSSFLPTKNKSILFKNAEKTYYPSDQLGFKKAVTVVALKHKKMIGHYIDRIHTSRDTIFDKANIKLICESMLNFLKQI